MTECLDMTLSRCLGLAGLFCALLCAPACSPPGGGEGFTTTSPLASREISVADVVDQASDSIVIHPYDIRLEEGELLAVMVFVGPQGQLLSAVYDLGRRVQFGDFGKHVRVVGPEGDLLAFEDPWRPSLVDHLLSSGGFPPGPGSEDFPPYQTESTDSRLVAFPIKSKPRPGEYVLETRSVEVDRPYSRAGLKFLDMAVSVAVTKEQDGGEE
jgi:hypothetical protein